MTVYFARPRHEYASYRDLYALIDLSGFEWVYIDEIQPDSDNAYIITMQNGELPSEGYPNARAKIVLWDLEYRREAYQPLANVERWHMDKWQAEMLGAKYAPVGSHPDLRPNIDSTSSERYDVAYIGYINGVHRRERIRHELQQRGVKLSPPVAWGDERHRVLSNSAAYLHVHQWDDIPAVPALRLVVAAAYGLPVIIEDVANYGVFGAYCFGIPYKDIPEVVNDWLLARNGAFGKVIEHLGQNLHQLLCHDLTFRKSVEAAL